MNVIYSMVPVLVYTVLVWDILTMWPILQEEEKQRKKGIGNTMSCTK